jgi:acetyl esterase/lipase
MSQEVVRLYEGRAPGSEGWTHQEQQQYNDIWGTEIVFNVVDPTLTVFRPAAGTANGAAVVVCPGGGFYGLSINSEGFDVARWLNGKGVTCFVLKYRLLPSQTDDPVKEREGASHEGRTAQTLPIIRMAMNDGLQAIRYVRAHAAEYGVDPQRIGIMGFSAGGTLTASVAYNYTAESRPNFVAPIYLAYDWVIKDQGAVPSDAGPIFVLAATDDNLGLTPGSVAIYQEWVAAGKSAELHLYAQGSHGFGMKVQNLPSDRWIALFADWLAAMGFTGA